MRGDEWSGENSRVNNGVCLRFSAASRLREAPRFATASANLVSVRSQGPVTVRPHTRTHTHTHTHTHTNTHTLMNALRELLPWEPTPLWLFPSQENNRHQSFSTSLSFIVSFFLLFFSGRYKLSPLFITRTGPLLSSPPCAGANTPCPPVSPVLSSPLSSLRVSDRHEFDLLCIIYPRWDLYSSHKWKSSPDLHKQYAGCFLAVAKETWWKEGLFVISRKAGEQSTWLKIEK